MIHVENAYLPVVALTHPGMKGKNNEDRYAVSAFKQENKNAKPVLLAVLSDGIGGNRAGEIASELAVDIISQVVADSDGKDPLATLEEAIRLASQTIHQQAQQNPEQLGMGATCACAWIAGDQLFTATVGDSRVYLMRNDQILQLSVDHTWVQEALDRGLIQPEQVNNHPNAHVIRRYLGSPTPPEVDFRMRVYEDESDTQSITNQGMKMLPNDHLLLCSDGLTDLVRDDEILEILREQTLQEAGQTLIAMANQRGGHDNITLIAIQVPPKKQAGTLLPALPAFTRMMTFGCLGVVVLGILFGGVLGGWFLFAREATATPTADILSETDFPLVTTLTGLPDVAPTLTPSPAVSDTPLVQPALPVVSTTPNPAPTLNAGPTYTPWPTNTRALPSPSATPTAPLPVVTVVP